MPLLTIARLRAAALVTLVVTALVAGCGSGSASTTPTSRTSARWTAAGFPEPPAPSPQTPAGFRQGPAATLAGDGPGAVPTGAARPAINSATNAPAPAPPGADGPFCAEVRSRLGTLTSNGLQGLTSLTTMATGSVPALKAYAGQVQADLTGLKAAAPVSVRTSVETLASAWSALSAELARDGVGRTEVIALAIKYLTNPAVAVAWEVLAKYATAQCGVDLGGR